MECSRRSLGGRVQMLPPLPGAWWWLEITEITDLGLGIWVHHDVKSTNKIYSFKTKKLSVRNKEQKMSLFVSLHTFVEKPVRFEALQFSGDNDICSFVSAPSSGCMASTWAPSISSQSPSENREGSWEMTTFILRSVGYKTTDLILHLTGHSEQHTTKHFKRGIPKLHQALFLLFLNFVTLSRNY